VSGLHIILGLGAVAIVAMTVWSRLPARVRGRMREVVPRAIAWNKRRQLRQRIEKLVIDDAIRRAQAREALEPHDCGSLPYRRGWKGGRR